MFIMKKDATPCPVNISFFSYCMSIISNGWYHEFSGAVFWILGLKDRSWGFDSEKFNV